MFKENEKEQKEETEKKKTLVINNDIIQSKLLGKRFKRS